MIIVGMDLETTGLDLANDKIIELGAVAWDVGRGVPVKFFNELVYDDDYPKPEEIVIDSSGNTIADLTGITWDDLEKYGQLPSYVFRCFADFVADVDAEYIVAHNGENFDKPMFFANCGAIGYDPLLSHIPWLDTQKDIPPQGMHEPRYRSLLGWSAELGFVNPFPHRAITDVLTMLTIMSHYNFNEMVEYSKIPWITVRAMVSFDNRQQAKDRRYYWENIGDKRFEKCWVKLIKECDFDKEQSEAPFEVVQIKE